MGHQRSGYPRRHLPRHRRHLHTQWDRFRRDDEKRYPAGARHTQVERQFRALGYRRLELRQESAGGTEDQIIGVKHASIQPTTQRKGALTASQPYRRRATPVGSLAPEADLRDAVLQTKANRQLYCRFLRTRRTTRCGDRRPTTLRALASRTRQAPHRLPEPDGLTSVTLLRPRGSAGAGFRSRGDLSNRGGKKSPLISPFSKGGKLQRL